MLHVKFKMVDVLLFVAMITKTSCAPSYSVSYSDVATLHSNLTVGYNKEIRPEIVQSTPTLVDVSFNMISLQDINDVQGTVTISGFFDLQWKDFNLAWSNSLGIDCLQISESSVWIPPLVNGNSIKKFKILSVNKLKVTVEPDGSVYYYPGDSFTFSCDIDSSNFPFDTQVCAMDMFSMSYQSTALEFVPGSVYTNLFTTNSEWIFIDATVSSKVYGFGTLPGFKIDFTFKRRSAFYVLNLLIPIDFLGFLNIFVFILPQESGERIGFSIAAVLAAVIFITVAQGYLPATATPKLASLYGVLIQDMALSGCIVVSVIIGSWLYYKDDKKPIPEWIRKVVLFKFTPVFQFCKRKIIFAFRKCKQKTTRGISDSSTVLPIKEEDTTTTVDEEKEEKNETITWKRVSERWDLISFCFYLLWFIEGNLKFIIDTQPGR